MTLSPISSGSKKSAPTEVARRTIKRAIQHTMERGAKGVKIVISGRLGGQEIARTEKQAQGLDVKPVFRDMAYFFFNSPEYLANNTKPGGWPQRPVRVSMRNSPGG